MLEGMLTCLFSNALIGQMLYLYTFGISKCYSHYPFVRILTLSMHFVLY